MELTENKALECKEYNEEILGETKIDDKIVNKRLFFIIIHPIIL